MADHTNSTVIDLENEVLFRERSDGSRCKNNVFRVRRRDAFGVVRESIEIGTHTEIAAMPYLFIEQIDLDVVLHTNRGGFWLHTGRFK